MAQLTFIDTFSSFLAFWNQYSCHPLSTQIEAWSTEYMIQWPELLAKQLDSYISENMDWRQVACEYVFPFLNDRLPAMKTAHTNLLKVSEDIYLASQEKFGIERDLIFVIYVGIGCGAGWGTQFQNIPAVLFGLENIAECGWSHLRSIQGLAAHEIGHIVHNSWREEHEKLAGSGPWWQLYREGFAQRCEHIILGENSWHMISDFTGEDWINWCHNNTAWLAAEFLRRTTEGESTHSFFGSWFDLQGQRQCGYFLGHEVIKQLENSMSIKEIALLEDIEVRLFQVLEELSIYSN